MPNPRPKVRAPHVVVSNFNGGYRLQCLHCQATYDPALPVSIPVFAAMGQAFVAEHEHCPEPRP